MIRVRMLALGASLALAVVSSVACTSTPATPTPSVAAATNAPLVCGRPPGTPTVAGRMVLRTNQCLVVQEPGGQLHQLFQSTATNIYPSLPVWSPDGTKIAFTQQLFFSGKPGADWGDDLYVVSASGGTPELVRTHAPTGEQIQGVAWTPDGKALVFGEFEPIIDAKGQITRYDGHLRRIDIATKAETNILDGAFTPSFSRDGKRMAFMKDEGLFVAGAEAKNATLLIPKGQFGSVYFPRISPDGASVAFSASPPTTSARPMWPQRPPAAPASVLKRLASLFFAPRTAEAHGVPMDVWRIDASTKALTQLTKFFEDEPQPAWSADGKLLVVHATGGLYEVAADGSSVGGAKTIGPGAFGGLVDVH
jgi:Tol biopolymer transport system component